MIARRSLVAVITMLGLFALPAAASAAVDVSDVVATPTSATCGPGASTDAPAGAHRDFCVSFAMDGGGADDAKDLEVRLPPGVIGDPTAAARCDHTTFDASGCGDAAARVGAVSAVVDVFLLPLLPPVQMTVPGDVYNLTTNPDEPARLGIQLDGLGGLLPVRVQSTIRVRLDDYGLTSVVKDMPRTLPGLGTPIDLRRMSLTLWGTHAGLTKPFITLPTRCDVPATTTIAVTSYAGATRTGTDQFTPTGCAKVPFTPSLEITPTELPADTPGEASATIVVPGADTTGTDGIARRQSYLRRVALQLPEGIALNPPLGNGLEPCTEEQFGLTEDRRPDCPASSEIGSVEFTTPLFAAPLTGKVYFGVPRPGERLRNFVSVEDPRLRVKLIGGVTVDEATGAITNVFEDSPQVPFTRFKFTYNGGPRAVLTSPLTCGPRTVQAPMTPWSGQPTMVPTGTFDTIDCPPPAFTPALGVTLDTLAAGADTAMTVHIERPDRQTRLKRVTVELPPGLAGRLGAVPACALADARAAACADASQVGTAAVSVGTGPAPLSLPGKVFLTEGYDGSIAGLAIAVPARVPALDLGMVVTLARIVVRGDGGIDVITDDLPQSVLGIPVAYRSIDLRIDRPGFLRNGTGCAPQAVHGVFTAVDGTTAAGDAPYAPTGCDALPFSPTLDATLGSRGQTGAGKHPPLQVVLRQGAGEAAMQRTTVTLPEGVSVDLAHLGGACSDAQLDAGACPAASRIGSVRADTPLLPGALSGGAYLMLPKPGHLPGLALDLGLVRLRGDVSFGAGEGRLTTVFDGIPDVPISRLVLALDGGTKGALSTAGDLCAQDPAIDATFVSHGGATRTTRRPAAVAGCDGLAVTGRLAGVAKRRPTLALTAVSTAPLRELRIALPKKLRAAAATRLRKAARVLVAGKRDRSAKVRWRHGRLVVTGLRGARDVAVTLARGGLRERGRLKAGQWLRLSVTAIATDGKARAAKLWVRARR